MFIVKLGGSVITDKTKKDRFRKKVMDQLAFEIKKANQEFIIVHGAGSFGHILAKEYKLNEGYMFDEQLQGFALTHARVRLLNSLVLTSLHDHDIPAVSLPPHVLLKLDNHKLSQMNYDIFKGYLDKKFVPVTFGDVILDESLGFSICSGDLLVHLLAAHFKPEKVIFVIDEDGLYSSNPKLDKQATFIADATIKDLEKLATPSDKHADVTKGMKGKVDTIKKIAALGIDIVLVNGNTHNRLYDILVGKEDTKHTFIHGGKQ